MPIDYAITEEEVLAVVTCEALALTREILMSKRCECAPCAAGFHGHAWALTDQRCSCSCHSAQARAA